MNLITWITFSSIISFLWHNNYLKIEKAVIHFYKLSNKNINFLSQLFENGRIMSRVNLKDEYKLTNDMFFQWVQLKHVIPTRWKTLISDFIDIDENNLCQNHHVIKGILEFCLPQTSISKLFENTALDWSKIYLLPRLATIDTTLRSFQYKTLNNLLFLNKKIYNFGTTNTALFSFCKTCRNSHTYPLWLNSC